MTFVLEEALLGALRPGERERFELSELDVPRLRIAFRRIAAHPDAELARAEFFRVMQLVITLRDSHGSPAAAAAIRALVDAEPEMVARLRESLGRTRTRAGSMDQTRRFLRSEGREVVLRAPTPPGPWKGRAARRTE